MAGEKIKIQLIAEAGTLSELTALCAPLGIEHCTESQLALVQTETHLALRKLCLLYTSPSPRDYAASRMPSSA